MTYISEINKLHMVLHPKLECIGSRTRGLEVGEAQPTIIPEFVPGKSILWVQKSQFSGNAATREHRVVPIEC